MNGVFFLPAIDRQRQGNDADSVGGLQKSTEKASLSEEQLFALYAYSVKTYKNR